MTGTKRERPCVTKWITIYSTPNYGNVAAYIRANYSTLLAAGVNVQYLDESCVVD
ncbi:MAG: hypothetical protein HFF89_07585 [Oscillibacter sp.]|nr:hypothetical protein [Oscillibacter sp.]MCI8690687.1 hypothetical protein [Oscillibacter sp.]